jgi:hypothetical protein
MMTATGENQSPDNRGFVWKQTKQKEPMKRLQFAIIVAGCFAACTANAQDADGGKDLSEAEAKQRQSVIEKYDTNGDGVLSKSEQKGLSKADKKTLARTGGVGTARKAPKQKAQKPDKDGDGEHEQSADKDHNPKGHDATKADKGGKPQENGSGGKDKGKK